MKNNETITSLKTSKKLKEMGCDVESDYWWYFERGEGWLLVDTTFADKSQSEDEYPTYKLRDIICNGEMARTFFGKETHYFSVEVSPTHRWRLPNSINASKSYQIHSMHILTLLHKNKQEEAEKYLLENCIFNKQSK